jgi:hypothetical protein
MSAVFFATTALVVFLGVSGCARGSAAAPEIRLHQPAGAARHVIDVAGLADGDLARLRDAQLTPEQWSDVLRVSVGDDQPAMLGDYTVVDGALRFTPMFPFDPGRTYHVSFRPGAIPGTADANAPALSSAVGLPAPDRTPRTSVAHVFPSADVVPANQLRLYIHFSGPMGRRGGLDHIRLLDDAGQAVVDPFLPLDAEFWNDDHTRYTVFFDPGRQKRGILPNQQMGRSLEPGKRYTLVVSREWRDENGLPLVGDFRRAFTVGPPDERPLDPQSWEIAAPPAGSSDPLTVTFPEPLDHGLLLRALGVAGPDGRFVAGGVRIDAHEKRWTFTPRGAWSAGPYQLVALGMLEDLAGNRIGRAFEVDNFERSDSSPEPERTTIPITLK